MEDIVVFLALKVFNSDNVLHVVYGAVPSKGLFTYLKMFEILNFWNKSWPKLLPKDESFSMLKESVFFSQNIQNYLAINPGFNVNF